MTAAVESIAEQYHISPLLPRESVERTPPARIYLPWNDFLLRLCADADQADAEAHMRRHQKWLRNLRHWEGRMLGYIDETTGQWADAARQPGDPVYIFNLVQYYVNTIIKEASRSRAEFSVLAVSDRLEHVMGARAFRAAIEEIQRNRWTVAEAQRAAKFWVLTGNEFVRSGVTQSRRLKTRRPRYETRPVRIGGRAYYCADCGAMGDYEEVIQAESAAGQALNRCPHCGSPSVVVTEGAEVQEQVLAGFDLAPATEIEAEVVDPFQVKLDLNSADLKSASFLRNLTLVRTEVLQVFYEWADITTSLTQDHGLRAQQELQRSAGNTSISTVGQIVGSGWQEGLTEFAEYWFEPVRYAHYRFPQETRLASGEVIARGARLSDLAPTGLKIVRAGGLIVEIAEEAKNDYWTQAVWEVAPDNVYGLGIENLIVANELHNRLMSLFFEATLKEVAPKRIYNQLKIGKTAFTARPGWASPMRNPTPTDNPGQYIHVDQAQPLGQAAIQLSEVMKGEMGQLAGGVFSQLSGDPAIRTDTLGGMAIMREQALSNLLTRLELRVDREVEMVRQHARLIKQHDLLEFYLRRASAYADFEVAMAAEMDPDLDLKISVRPGSFVPRSELERRNDITDALTLGGLPGGVWNPAIPEFVRRLALERLNVPYNTDQMTVGERQQRMELHRLTLLAWQCERYGLDEEQCLALARQQAPVNFLFEDHETHIRHIEEWMNTDAGMLAARHPIASLLIVDHLMQHLRGPTLRQQMIAQAQLETALQTASPDEIALSEGAAQQQDPAAQPEQGRQQPGPPTPAQAREPGNPTIPRAQAPRT
jgi:DNA-directed RNA polymerase subunit RPC12/RpoP